MRITDSTLAFATTHTYTASLEAQRSITAWEGDKRVQTTEAVKVTLSERSASAVLAQVGDGTYRAFPGSATGHGNGHGNGMGNGAGRGMGLAALQALQASISRAPASGAPSPLSAPPAGPSEDTGQVLSANDQAWLLLVN
ncbi:MAG: hypothetical protein WCK58_18855, partial [Chloroflexota bacterium]